MILLYMSTVEEESKPTPPPPPPLPIDPSAQRTEGSHIILAQHVVKTDWPEPMKGVSAMYYTNMERSTDRRIHMETILQDPIFDGIPVERIEGIDGKTDDITKYLDFYQCTKNPRMMDTEYGCTLSHFRAIHQFAMTDEPVALIMEDDFSTDFVPYWKQPMSRIIDGAPPDWEILQLSYILFDTMPEEEYELWEMKKNFCGTLAYLITNAAAKRLIQYLCRFSSPAMPKYCIGPEVHYYHHADRFLYCFLKTYSYHCPPFTYRDDNDSIIHPEHVDFHSESKEKTKKLYLRFCDHIP